MTAKVFLSEGYVIVSQTMPASAVDAGTLQQAVCQVGSIADDIGVMAAAVFGGETPIEPEPAEQAG